MVDAVALTGPLARRQKLHEQINRDLHLDDEDIAVFAPIPRTRRAKSQSETTGPKKFRSGSSPIDFDNLEGSSQNNNIFKRKSSASRGPRKATNAVNVSNISAFGRTTNRTANRHIDGAPKISKKSGLLYGGTSYTGPVHNVYKPPAGGGFSGGSSTGGVGEPNTLLLGATPGTGYTGGRIWSGAQPDSLTSNVSKILTVQNANSSRTRPVPFSCCAFSGDGQIIGVGDKRGSVVLFYMKQNRFATLEKGGVGANSRATIGCLGFTKRRIEEILVANSTTLRVYSVDSRKLTATLKTAHSRPITTIDASLYGGFVLSASQDLCQLWSLENWTSLRKLFTSGSPLNDAKFASFGTGGVGGVMVCTLFAEGRLTFWDCCANFERVQELQINGAGMSGVVGGVASNAGSINTIRNLRLFEQDTKYIVAAGSEDFIVWNRLNQSVVHHARVRKPIVQLQLGRFVPTIGRRLEEQICGGTTSSSDQEGKSGNTGTLSSMALVLHDDGSLQGIRLNTLEVVLTMEPNANLLRVNQPGNSSGVVQVSPNDGSMGAGLRQAPYSFFRVDEFSKLICLLKSDGEMEIRTIHGEVLREARQRAQRAKLCGRVQVEIYGEDVFKEQEEIEEFYRAQQRMLHGVENSFDKGYGEGGGYERVYGVNEGGNDGNTEATPTPVTIPVLHSVIDSEGNRVVGKGGLDGSQGTTKYPANSFEERDTLFSASPPVDDPLSISRLPLASSPLPEVIPDWVSQSRLEIDGDRTIDRTIDRTLDQSTSDWNPYSATRQRRSSTSLLSASLLSAVPAKTTSSKKATPVLNSNSFSKTSTKQTFNDEDLLRLYPPGGISEGAGAGYPGESPVTNVLPEPSEDEIPTLTGSKLPDFFQQQQPSLNHSRSRDYLNTMQNSNSSVKRNAFTPSRRRPENVIDPVAEGPQFAKQHLSRVLAESGMNTSTMNPNSSKKSVSILDASRRDIHGIEDPLQKSSGLGGNNSEINNKPTLNFQSLKKILLKRGSYPDQHRPLIWMFLFQLPGNQTAYEALISAPSPSGLSVEQEISNLTKAFPNHSRKTLSRLRCLLQALASWSPALRGLSTTSTTSISNTNSNTSNKLDDSSLLLSRLVFPFAKLFGANGCVAFEVSASILLVYCRRWFSNAEDRALIAAGVQGVAPLVIERDLDMFLSEHENELHSHLKKCMMKESEQGQGQADGNSSTSVAAHYLWPILQTLGTTILSRDNWLYIFDHLLTHWNKPYLLDAFVVSLLRFLKVKILRCGRESGVEAKLLLGREQPVNARAVVADMYRIHVYLEEHYGRLGGSDSGSNSGTMSAGGVNHNINHDKKPPVPLPKGCYPSFLDVGLEQKMRFSSGNANSNPRMVIGSGANSASRTPVKHMRTPVRNGNNNNNDNLRMPVSSADISVISARSGQSSILALPAEGDDQAQDGFVSNDDEDPQTIIEQGLERGLEGFSEVERCRRRPNPDQVQVVDFGSERARLERLILERERELLDLKGEIMRGVS